MSSKKSQRGKGPFIVLFAAVVLGMCAPAANAQNPAPKIKDIHGFVACLNSVQKQNQNIADSVRCVPPGCNYTVTMSQRSAQPACTMHDVMLPRVIFSCPGAGAGLRFRPSFTLCPGPGGKTELGEDVDTSHNQRMADIENPTTADVADFGSITEFTTGPVDTPSPTAVVNTMGNNKACVACHGSAGTVPGPGARTVLLSAPRLDMIKVLDTNDPNINILDTPPATPTPLSDICTAIETSTELANDPDVDFSLLVRLCERLDGKITGD